MVSVDRSPEFWSTVLVLSGNEINKPQRHLDSRYMKNRYIWMNRLNDPLYSLCVKLTENLNSIKSYLNELKQKSKKRDLFTNTSKELNELQTFIYNKLEEYSKDLEVMHKELNSSNLSRQGIDHWKTVADVYQTESENCCRRLQNFLKDVQESKIAQTKRFIKYQPNYIKVVKPIQQQQQQYQNYEEEGDNNNNNNTKSSGLRQRQIYNVTNTLMVDTTTTNDLLDEQHLKEQREIEKQMSMIGNLLNRMSNLVAIQSQQIVDIESNIDETEYHVDEGKMQLYKFMDIMKGNRSLILKLFLLMVVIILFSAFIRR